MTKKPKEQNTLSQWSRSYSLSLVLVSLFLLSWFGQFISQWISESNQAKMHSENMDLIAFLPEFIFSTLENWQSEFLQLFTFVVLATYFIHKGSPQSKDGDEELKQQIEQISKTVAELKNRK